MNGTLTFKAQTAQYDKDDVLWIFGTMSNENEYVCAFCVPGPTALKQMRRDPSSIVLMPGTPANMKTRSYALTADTGVVIVGVFPYKPNRYGIERGMFFDPEGVTEWYSEAIDLLTSQNNLTMVVDQRSPEQKSLRFDSEDWPLVELRDDSGRNLSDAMADAARKKGVDDPDGMIDAAKDETHRWYESDRREFRDKDTIFGDIAWGVLDAIAWIAIGKIFAKSKGWGVLLAIGFIVVSSIWSDNVADWFDQKCQKYLGLGWGSDDFEGTQRRSGGILHDNITPHDFKPQNQGQNRPTPPGNSGVYR